MTREQAEKFAVYHRMLIERNAQFNLTRVPDDLTEAVDRNYLDCISPLAKDFPEVKTAVDAMHFSPIGRTGCGGWGIFRRGDV